VTETEAKERSCPFYKASCKGRKCMMFDYVATEVVLTKDPKKPLNPPKDTLMDFFTCSLKQTPIIEESDESNSSGT